MRSYWKVSPRRVALAVKAPSPNHWATRKFPKAKVF